MGACVGPLVALYLIQDAVHEVSIVVVGIGGPLNGMVVEAAVAIVMEVVELGADKEFEGGVVSKGPEHLADVVCIALVFVKGNRVWAGHARA